MGSTNAGAALVGEMGGDGQRRGTCGLRRWCQSCDSHVDEHGALIVRCAIPLPRHANLDLLTQQIELFNADAQDATHFVSVQHPCLASLDVRGSLDEARNVDLITDHWLSTSPD